jgi:hypothetical protein
LVLDAAGLSACARASPAVPNAPAAVAANPACNTRRRDNPQQAHPKWIIVFSPNRNVLTALG